MNSENSAKEGPASPTGNSNQTRSHDNHQTKEGRQNGQSPGHDTQILRAKIRTERAEARSQEAETRTEQARTRTEQAEMRTEQAETRTEQAKTRADQAEMRTEQAETRTEQAIRASEFNYRRLFEAARNGILILEADSGRISDVNPFLTELLGFSLIELIGKPIWELGLFRNIVANKAKFEQLRQHGYLHTENLSLETKAGSKIMVEFASTVYQVGERNVIQCNVRDITVRKRFEEGIRARNLELEKCVAERTADLQLANHELEAFSYSVSHDLRAPLRHVLGFVDLVKEEAGPTLSEKCRRQLTTISEATQKMANLIDDLLAFSLLGKTEIQKLEVPLDELVRETVSDLQAQTKERNIVWEIHPLPAVQADSALLRQVFVNLISNAIKFTGTRAEAKIEIGCAAVDDAETTIFIRDNGAGFDMEYADKLFGVFQRLHSQEEFEGTGIGLANAQRIIQRHGGRTWADSKVDEGATFYFSLPKHSDKVRMKLENGSLRTH